MSTEDRDTPLDLPEPAEPAPEQIPEPNPFLLPGLPPFAGLDLPSAPGADDEGQAAVEEDDEDHEGSDYDDQYDAAAAAVWDELPFEPLPEPDVAPQLPYTPPNSVARSGKWDEWLARPSRPGLAREWDVTDYDLEDDPESLARRNVVDRTGRKPLVGIGLRGRQGDEDSPRTYTARSTGLAILTVLGLAVVVTTAVVVNVVGVTDSPLAAETTAPAGPAPSTTAAAEIWGHATASCRATQTSTLTVGAGPGDPATGAGAILGFEWAYYVDRSGPRAREFVAADAAVPATDAIQAGIDQVPPGTKYCVYATDQGAGIWHVELHEQYPSETAPQKFQQTITTRTGNGRTLITAIASR